MKSIRFIFLVAVLFAQFAFGLADSTNHNISVREGDTWIMYYGTLSFSTADSTSSLFTKAMSLDWVDVTKPIVLTVHGNSSAAAQDVNMFIEGANFAVDSLFENTYANVIFDDVDLFSADGVLTDIINYKTAAADTIATGISSQRTLIPFPDNIDGAFLRRFIRLEADGQAGNRSDVVVTWELLCQKKAGAPTNNAWGISNVAGGL